MDRQQFSLIVAVAALLATCDLAQAQSGADPRATAGPRRPIIGARGVPREFGSGDRLRFRRNAERWLRMAPAEQAYLRQRQTLRHERMNQAAEAAFAESRLRLDQQRREEFKGRYIQERKKLEQGLRRDLEDRRQQQLPELLDRLRREFQPRQIPVSPASGRQN